MSKTKPKSVCCTGTTLFLALTLASHGMARPPVAQPLRLAEDGRTTYRVALADNASETERFAAEELTNFLARVTGAAFPVVPESEAAGAVPAIYLGWTAFAGEQNIPLAELGEEEWVIRTVGDNLILTGGRPRGTMYAVYEFLEKQVGCHWLDARTEVVPERPTLTVGPLDVRAKPRFWRRQLHNPLGVPDNQWRFLVRNKNYRYDLQGRSDFFPEGAFYPLDGTPRKLHSFGDFVSAQNWFETHPEYFALVDGKRMPTSAGGQLCLTHPDVRRLTVEKLREFIAKDRELAAAGFLSSRQTISRPVPPPRVYMIGQEDRFRTHCQCDACQAVVEREGSESGPLVEYLNDVGEAIAPDHPDIILETLAYNLTQPPPKTVRPRENVLIGWCDVYSRSDALRPLSHPYNRHHYEEITRWGEISRRVGIGDDYWTMLSFYRGFPLPWTLAHCLISDLRLFADVGCETYFAEAHYYTDAGKNFINLEFWLAYQLLVDPYQPVEPLLDTFMAGYYGPAAAPMRAYYDYLTGRIDRDAQFMVYRYAPHLLAYLDLDFFLTSQRLFDEAQTQLAPASRTAGAAPVVYEWAGAQSQVAPGSPYAAHVLRERFIVDSALLYLWPWLERGLPDGQAMPFDPEQLVQRFELGWRNYQRHWHSRFYAAGDPHSLNHDGKHKERLIALFREPQVPEPFRDRPRADVADFNWLTFSHIRPRQKFVPDDDAVGGMAAEPTGLSAMLAAEDGAPLEGAEDAPPPPSKLVVGVTGGPTRTIPPEEIHQDGQFHLYRIGRMEVRPTTFPRPVPEGGDWRRHGWGARYGTLVWALDGQKLGVVVDRVYDPEATGPDANLWDAYISLKVDGPAFVAGSTAENGVWMDRVLLVKPRPGDTLSEAEQRRQAELAARDARRPRAAVPAIPDAGGDPAAVDWAQAADLGLWSTVRGEATDRAVTSRAARDNTHLYLRLAETAQGVELISSDDVFSGDVWELFFAAQRDLPYRQLAVSPAGKVTGLAYGENAGNWSEGVRVVSEAGEDGWTLSLALPLDRLTSGGVKPGQPVYTHLFRNGPRGALAWSPTWEGGFHVLDRMGELAF